MSAVKTAFGFPVSNPAECLQNVLFLFFELYTNLNDIVPQQLNAIFFYYKMSNMVFVLVF